MQKDKLVVGVREESKSDEGEEKYQRYTTFLVERKSDE